MTRQTTLLFDSHTSTPSLPTPDSRLPNKKSAALHERRWDIKRKKMSNIYLFNGEWGIGSKDIPFLISWGFNQDPLKLKHHNKPTSSLPLPTPDSQLPIFSIDQIPDSRFPTPDSLFS